MARVGNVRSIIYTDLALSTFTFIVENNNFFVHKKMLDGTTVLKLIFLLLFTIFITAKLLTDILAASFEGPDNYNQYKQK